MENKEELLHAVKVGAGGKPQNYDPTTGRFAPTMGAIKTSATAISGWGKGPAESMNKVAASTKNNKKAKHMSDEELKQTIARLQLEQTYSNLAPSRKSRGAQAAANALATIGSVAAVAASMATVALAIKEFRDDIKTKKD